MTFPFKVFIPARFASSRLPGKPLLKIGTKPLVRHVYEAAAESGAEEVVIVTDDDRIRIEAEGFGARVVMTSTAHESGTERISEAVVQGGEDESSIIVNVQGDEFNLSPLLVKQVAESLHWDVQASVATLCEKITAMEDFHDPNVVKVVFDKDRHALYFSRAAIPVQQSSATEEPTGFSHVPCRHIGIYAYRAAFLKIYAGLPACSLERSERLEQLRVLYHGYSIRVDEACTEGGIGVDTEADLERARSAVNGEE
ncbi:MAG: 3-deoxy-manno-octulosonate cytidylyltransferase [Gammaproteobacteria bacterium]